MKYGFNDFKKGTLTVYWPKKPNLCGIWQARPSTGTFDLTVLIKLVKYLKIAGYTEDPCGAGKVFRRVNDGVPSRDGLPIFNGLAQMGTARFSFNPLISAGMDISGRCKVRRAKYTMKFDFGVPPPSWYFDISTAMILCNRCCTGKITALITHWTGIMSDQNRLDQADSGT